MQEIFACDGNVKCAMNDITNVVHGADFQGKRTVERAEAQLSPFFAALTHT